PRHSPATLVQRWGSWAMVVASVLRISLNSSLSVVSGDGTRPVFSNSTPLWISRVASPPSSTIWVGPEPRPKAGIRSVHHQYSSSDSPFHANTGTPAGALAEPPFSGRPTAMAAAAWSWVLKILQEHQRTSAPRRSSV